MKKSAFILLILFLISAGFSRAQPLLDGDWEGYIDVTGSRLTIITHFTKEDTSYTGTIDIPQQNGKNIPLQNIRTTPQDSVFFEFFAGTGIASFKGKIKADTIKGTFHQSGRSFPFLLNQSNPEDKPAFPYEQQEVSIKNGNNIIAGSLTLPQKEPAKACVIFISGSGAQSRDANIFGFKIFRKMADYLTRQGIATFRFDDRGTGSSTGSFTEAPLDTLASDVEAILLHLNSIEKLKSADNILLGHSQGGILAGKIAAENRSVSGLVLMASPGITLKEILRYQVQDAYKREGIAPREARKEIAAREKLMHAINNGKNIEQAKQNYIKEYKSILEKIPEHRQKSLGNPDTLARNQASQLVSAFKTAQMQSFLFYDPVEDLRKTEVPVLVLFGGKDTQVPVSLNRKPIKKALEKAETDYEIKTFPSSNHLFQKAESGSASEYGRLEPAFVEGFLITIEEWINKQSSN